MKTYIGFGRRPGQEILQLHLDDSGIAAGLVVFGLLYDQRIIADHNHVASADFLCGFHLGSLKLLKK